MQNPLDLIKLPLTNQAKLIAVGYVLAIFSIAMLALMAPTMPNRAMTLIGIVLGAIVGTYAINCMVVGKCNTLAWVLSGFYSIMAFLLFVIMLFAAYMDNKK